jgi:Cu/Ag efflux protein CusF
MQKRALPLALVLALAAAAAQAQYGPGGGGGGGGGYGGGGRAGHGGQPSDSSSTTTPAATTPPPKPPKPMNQVAITGVVQAIDVPTLRVTIAYDAVDELGWPRGTMPFTAYNAALLQGLSVGEHVRFSLDSQRIVEIAPVGAAAPAPVYGARSPNPATSGPPSAP